MSMEVPLDTLADVAHGYGPTAYAVVSAPQGPPRITHVRPRFSDGLLGFGLGRRSIELLEQHRTLGVLWPANDGEAMSLIVDAEVVSILDDGEVHVRAVSGVRHRPAPSA